MPHPFGETVIVRQRSEAKLEVMAGPGVDASTGELRSLTEHAEAIRKAILWQVLLWYMSLHVSLLVDLTPLDYGVLAPEPSRRRVQCLGAIEHQQRRLCCVQSSLLKVLQELHA